MLLGHLSHASIAVRHERLYLRQLFALLSSAHQPFYYVRFNRSAWADIAWWLFFLKEWNGVSLSTRAHLSHYVFGCFGVVWLWCCGSRWCLVQWPPHWLSVDITVKKLVPVIFAAACWGPIWSGHHVRFNVDNMAIVQVVRNLNATSPQLCQLLRCLHFYSAYYNFTFSAAHIPGINNTAADDLSCGNISLFHSLFPQVPQFLIPPVLLDLFLMQTPDWNSAT